jgi:hypothetical protein
VTGDELIAALDLPAAARVDRRVPKTLLTEHGAPTAADKRKLNDGLEQVQWVATLKPATVGIAAYRDATREYLELAVLRVHLRPAAKPPRLLELLHRAVPYPVLALAEQGAWVNLSLAHKRWSQNEADKTVLDGDLVSIDAPTAGDALGPPFAAALALNQQPRQSLLTLYQGWIDACHALAAAARTGRFEIPSAAGQRTARREALAETARLDAEIARLRAAAKKEKQMARQVALNQSLKHAEAERAAAMTRL